MQVAGVGAAVAASWWGYAVADPRLVGALVGAVWLGAAGYLISRLVRRRERARAGPGARRR